MTVVKTKMKVYYKVIRRRILWKQDFKMESVFSVWHFFKHVCLPPKTNSGIAPKCPCYHPLLMSELGWCSEIKKLECLTSKLVPFGSGLELMSWGCTNRWTAPSHWDKAETQSLLPSPHCMLKPGAASTWRGKGAILFAWRLLLKPPILASTLGWACPVEGAFI